MRRGLKETIGRIWKGFEFELKSPSKFWQKKIGSKNVGASFGLIIKNQMELKIGKLIFLFHKNVIYPTI